MKILTRYVLREHVGPLLFSIAALTALLLLQQVAKRFGDLVGKGLGWEVIGEFFVLSIPFIIAMTLPMAVLVAVLYAFSRLAAENEITALRACGVSITGLVRPVFWGGVVVAILMLGFNDQVLSRSNHRLRTLQTDIARKKPTFTLREQVINEVSPGKLLMKTGHIDQASNRLREITIYDFTNPLRRRTIYADSGRMGITPDMQDLQMTLYDGYIITIPRDQPGQLQRVFFTKDLVRVRGVGNELQRTAEDNYKGSREMSVCEMETQYQQKLAEYAQMQRQLGDAFAEAVHRAVTGDIPEGPLVRTRVDPKRDTVSTPPEPLTVGSVYCSMIQAIGRLGKVRMASAAEPPAPRPPAQGVGQAGGSASARRARLARPDNGVPPRQTRDTTRTAAPGAARPATPAAAQRAVAERNIDIARRGLPKQPLVSDATLAADIARLTVIQSRTMNARRSMSDYAVEIQKKFALAAACMVFVILGAPIALRFPRGGVGLVIGVSIVVFALYYVGLIAGQTLANNLIISPFWAMWLANIVFTVVGIYLLARVQRSGATARGGDFGEMVDTVRGWFTRRRSRVRGAADQSRSTA